MRSTDFKHNTLINLTAKDLFSLYGINPHTSLLGEEGDISEKRDTFEAMIERRWGTALTPPKVMKTDDDPWEEYHDENEDPRQIPDVEDIVDKKGNSYVSSQHMKDS